MGIAEGYIILGDNLSAQLVTPLVWGIEPQIYLPILLGDVVYQRPSVVAQSRAVAHNPFCVVSYNNFRHIGCKDTK